jgi:GWxTD domain-containing protein
MKIQKATYKTFLSLLLILSITISIISCHTNPNSVTHQNVSTQYQPEEKLLRAKYCLYNVTDSLTRLYFSVNSTDLLYTKNQEDERFSAHIMLSYIVHPIEYAKAVADSGHVVMSDVGTPGQSKLLASSVDMDVLQTGKYFIEVTFRDLNKMTISYELLYLDHTGKDARNNFLISEPQTETPLFKSYIDSSEEFSIRYYHPEIKKLFVKYYKNRSGPALPPYSYDRRTNVYFPDSTYWMDFTPTSVFKLKKEGWYTFNTDTASTNGIMIARFNDGFPKITLARQMVYPLRYLTMHDEYVAMDTATNIKKAVDKFWLNNTGSEERARIVIRDFYNRVEITNDLFSTQIEGWKTDRGMIYLAFGPPQNVYRSPYSETWIYGNTVGPGSLTLVFDHKDDAFTDQEFVLARNEDYKVNWITAVDSWRQGHVYTLR